MTCISPWNGQAGFPGGVTGAGTAITAQHIINAAHFPLEVGNAVRFVTADNVVVTRTIIGKAQHPAYVGQSDGWQNDLTVYTLDSPLPASITPCKMLPGNYGDYLSYLEMARPPAILLDRHERAQLSELGLLAAQAAYFPSDLLPIRASFYPGMGTGDSGNPAFLIIGNELVLLSTHTFPPLGTFVTRQISTLNAMIETADANAGIPATGLQIQTVDLSSFTPFNPP